MNIVQFLGSAEMNNVQVPIATSRKSERRAHLVEVARGLIAAHGLRSLKVRDVAAAAECSIGTVYNEFVDLDELVLTVNRETMRALEAAMAAVPSEDPIQQLHGFAQGYLSFASEHPNLLRSLFE